MRNLAYALIGVAACSGTIRHQAAGTTAEILALAQPSLQQENDYELAARAVPGALKTIEGFYAADAQPKLREVLTEGYCQYANAFVEDEWELAKFQKKLDDAAYHSERASKMYSRCLNYALVDMGKDFEQDLYGQPEVAIKRIKSITGGKLRTPLMWVGLGLGGVLNHNIARSDAVAYLPIVRAIIEHVIEIDRREVGELDGIKHALCAGRDDQAPCTVRLALPHVALGMVLTAAGPQFGGDPKRASDEFQTALRISADAKHPDGRMLLARVLLAYRVGVATNDRKLFHEQLVKVLETDPAIWPEERLANEVAHRRAKRYLQHEKELFQ